MRIRLLIFCTLNYFISSLVSLSIHRNDTLDLQTSSSSPDLSLNTTSPSVSVSVKHQPFHEYHDHPDDSLWTEDAIRFNNHKLYSILIEKDEEKVEKLRSLRDKMDIDFWNEPELGKKINFRVSPLYQEDVEKYLNSTSLMYEIITDDLQKWIDRERKENRECDFLSGRQDASNFQLDHYHTLEEINAYMDLLEKRYPDAVQIIKIGTTYENHDIRVIRIGLPNNWTTPVSKSAVWLDAGIHAREWIAPATAIYIMNELATRHETDAEIKELITKFDWYILPVANPDGYIYTWWTNRLWRKNRALPKAMPFRYPWGLFDDCLGTDPNRNFDVDFGGASTSSNPCSDIFRGDFAFSEKETQAIRDAVQDLGDRLKVFISLHSYSQMWMFPWGFSSKKSPHHDELSNLVLRVVLAVQKKHGTWYRHGPIATTIYPAAGSSPDWAHDKAKVKYSFIAELRDRGDNGFLLPRQQILPTAEETWEGVKVIAHDVKG